MVSVGASLTVRPGLAYGTPDTWKEAEACCYALPFPQA